MTVSSRLHGLATARGARIRDAAARADLLLSGGLRMAVQHVREDRLARAAESAASDRVYDAIWADACERIGAEMERLHGAFIRIRKGGAQTLVWRQWVQLDDAVTVRAALDRTFVHTALAEHGIPVPENLTVAVSELDAGAAAGFLRRHGSVVVKPASGTGGGGATADVRTPDELRRAALLASRHGAQVILERRMPGDVYRLLFLDGELLDVVRRHPPRITGDGRTTVRDLIHAENVRRLDAAGDAGLPLITANLDLVLTLARQGMTTSSVPDAGHRMDVKTVTNQSGPADNETVTAPADPKLVAQARQAAAAIGVRLAGVDIVTPDLRSGLAEAGGAVIEVNAGPGLHHHYHVADREAATPVCVPILNALLQDASGGRGRRRAAARDTSAA